MGRAKPKPINVSFVPNPGETVRQCIARVLKPLSYREREVFKLRYGLGDGMQYTLEEIAHVMHVTRERIRSIETQAIKKLKSHYMFRPEPDHEPMPPTDEPVETEAFA